MFKGSDLADQMGVNASVAQTETREFVQRSEEFQEEFSEGPKVASTAPSSPATPSVGPCTHLRLPALAIGCLHLEERERCRGLE